MELIRARAAGLVRRGARATILLALVAGLTAGVAMAMVAAGRRTATAYDRLFAYADVPELLVNFCPPGFDPEADPFSDCYTYQPIEERDTIRELPEVREAVRASFRGLTIAPISSPEDTVVASTLVAFDEGIAPALAGRYLVVSGRDAKQADEILLNERLADLTGLRVGDRAVLTFWSPEELGTFDAAAELHGPTMDVEVVGVARGLTDLTAIDGVQTNNESTLLYTAPALGAATPDAGGFTGMLVEADDDDAGAATAAIEQAFSDRLLNISPGMDIDEIEPTRDAIRYEAQATVALGFIVAVLAIVFVGQAIARQSRREWADGPVLRAVGMTTRDATASAALRSLTIGIPAALGAVATALLLSPRGPVGVGRRAEVDPGFQADGRVLILGGAAVVVVCALSACLPLVRGRALRAPVATPPRRRARRSFGLPAVANAGVHLARDGRGRGIEVGTALASAAAAVVGIVAAAALVASFDDLVRTPARFGAPWDVSVSVPLEDEEAVASVLRQPELRRSIDQAAVIRGSDLLIGDEEGWVHAYVPIDGVAEEALPVPIDEGRPPATPREIAIGALTLADLDLSIGDRVVLSSMAGGEGQAFDLTIVGTAMINDNFEASPGRGAIVTPELIAEAAPEGQSGDPVIVSVVPGTDVDAFIEELRSRHLQAVLPPLPQAALRNVERIRGLPLVMAAVVATLALASLVHALVLSVGRNRRTLGMLKGLGFTRRQVRATVAWHASTYAVVAAAIGLPLGVIVGRLGWRLVAGSLGVPDVPILPAATVIGVTGALVVLANLAAAYPGWRAARLSTAAALRSE